jgi:hypothetical protein
MHIITTRIYEETYYGICHGSPCLSIRQAIYEVFKFCTPLFYQPLATANPTQAILNCAFQDKSFLDSHGQL